MRENDIRENPDAIRRILIIGLSCLGDNLLLTPAISLLRDTCPEAEMEIVVGPRAVEFARDNPWFSKYHILNKKKGVVGLVRLLRKGNYDLLIDFRTSLMPFFLKAKRKLTFFWEELSSDKNFTHESKRVLAFLAPYFGVVEEPELAFPLSNDERTRMARHFCARGIKNSEVVAVLNPGAKFAAKRWSRDKFVETGRQLAHEYAARIIVVGGKREERLGREVAFGVGKTGAVNLAGKTTVRELAALLERADVMVTNDTGPMHMAVAVGCPVVALFGPTNPYRYGPVGRKHQVVHTTMECFPCSERSRCARQFECMNTITVDEVMKACRLVLDEGKQLSLFDV